MNEFQIEVEEGFFGQNFGPNFDTVTGGGVGLSPGLLLWLLGRRKKKRLLLKPPRMGSSPSLKGDSSKPKPLAKPSLTYLVRLLKTLDVIALLDNGSASN